MTNSLPLPSPGFDDLGVEEQIDYVQSLWDRIAARPDQVPIPEWHSQVLNERLTAHQANPEVAKPWEEVRDDPVEAWQAADALMHELVTRLVSQVAEKLFLAADKRR